jgi:threonine dehydrogenase-like Zn-dependent dehydrogenase
MVYRDDVDEPVVGPGQVLVDVRACGICGSDLHFAKHGDEVLSLMDQIEGMPTQGAFVDLSNDVFMGHEFSAEVLQAGPGTDAPPAGTVVTSIPVLVSGKGFDTIVYSNTVLGGYAERMLLSAPVAQGSQRAGCTARRADRADGRRPARGQQVRHPAR